AAILDPSTSKVLVFAGANTFPANAVVIQADTALTAGSKVTVDVGQSSGTQVHAGTFDNNYFNSLSTGGLYVCGKNSGNNNPALYRIGFDGSGNLNPSIKAGPLQLATAVGECSPLSEIFNSSQAGGTDWLFAGVPGTCAFG